MRHGPAEDQAPSGRDEDRALTTPGRERVKRVAEELFRRSETPRVVLSSPLVRSLQTAEIVAQICKPEQPVEVFRELCPGLGLMPFVRDLLRSGRRRVMIVGHEPELGELAYHLSPVFNMPFEKAMVVSFKLTGDDAPLFRFALEPRSLTFRT